MENSLSKFVEKKEKSMSKFVEKKENSMSKIIEKKNLREVIRLSKKWWYTEDDNDNVYNQLYDARVKAFGAPYTKLNDLVMGIVGLNKKAPLTTYYKVLEVLGYELI